MKSTEKTRVALLFGGKSTEHEVSIRSAWSIIENFDRTRYDLLLVKISKQGRWMLLPDADTLRSSRALEREEGPAVVIGDPVTPGLLRIEGEGLDSPGTGAEVVDVVFPILHGTYGEDGTLQGLLSLAGLPFVGSGVLASSLCMDKVMAKQMFFQNELASADFMWFLRKDWRTKPDAIREGIESEIGYPCFVKPANSGSSVGVKKAHDDTEITAAVDEAALYDRKILVEKAIDARELECAVLGNDEPRASVVGEVVPANEFYDYDAKYADERSRTLIPADIPDDISETVRSMAVSAFKAMDCAGMARVDFLLEKKTRHVFLNELNTIPGFTSISMYSKLWEASGTPYKALISKLIDLAIERHDDLEQSRFLRT